MVAARLATFPTIIGFEASGLLSNQGVEDLLNEVPNRKIGNPHLIEIKYENRVRLANPRDRRSNPTLVLGLCEIDRGTKTAQI